jgi:hypothetical protein
MSAAITVRRAKRKRRGKRHDECGSRHCHRAGSGVIAGTFVIKGYVAWIMFTAWKVARQFRREAFESARKQRERNRLERNRRKR